MNAYRFNKTKTNINQPDILNGKTEKEFLKEKFQSGCMFGIDNLMHSGSYRIHGWQFNFKPFLKLYWYQTESGIYSVYAPNKTALRTIVYGRIYKIMEVTK